MCTVREHMTSDLSDLEFWLFFMSNQNSLSSSSGMSAWTDGLAMIRNLQIRSFSAPDIHDKSAIQFLRCLRNRQIREFDVIGDSLLRFSSPLYRAIQDLAKEQKISYSFTHEAEGTFAPWSNTIELGAKFVGHFEGRPTIPFYSFNHENAHVALFRPCYADLNLTDAALERLYLLIEWFCISLDLILAHDLGCSGSTGALKQMDSMTPSHDFFSKSIGSMDEVDRIADRFRECLMNKADDVLVEQMISPLALEKHRNYTRHTLVPECRKVRRQTHADDTGLELLESASLSKLVLHFLGIDYAS